MSANIEQIKAMLERAGKTNLLQKQKIDLDKERLQLEDTPYLDEAAEEWCKTNNKGIALSADKKSHYLTEGKESFKAGAEVDGGTGIHKRRNCTSR